MLILVADDLEDARQIMRLLLELKGYQVIEASNGREAVDLATQQSPDFILMDLNMPVMDGITAARHLRRQPATARVPIIALTAHSGDGAWRKHAMDAGCSDYFSKPLDFEALHMAIESFSNGTNQTGVTGFPQGGQRESGSAATVTPDRRARSR